MQKAHPDKTIFRSKFSEVKIPNQSLPEFVLERCPDFGERVAIVDGENASNSIKYCDLAALVASFGSSLSNAGIGKGNVVALFAPNIPEYLVAFHGILSIGAICTTINASYTAAEVEYQLQDSGAVMVFTVKTLLPVAEKAREQCPSIKQILVFDDVSYQEFMAKGDSKFKSSVTINPEEDVAALPYSSGTTGIAKGVKLTHRNLVANICQITHPLIVTVTPDDVLIGVLPFSHIYGMIVVLNVALRYGAKSVTLKHFQPELFLKTLVTHKVTIAHVVPPLVSFLGHHPAVEPYLPELTENLKELFSGAAPLSKELAQDAATRLNVMVRQGYGMTELSPACLVSPLGSAKLGSGGMILPNTEVKLLDNDGSFVGVYTPSELCVRGPQLMQGYWKNDEATKECMLPDGFMRTGDVVVMDEEGAFFLVDRVKDLIKCNGFPIAPIEVENRLKSHDSIADAAVVGVKDDREGEVPKAFVVLKPGATLNEQELKVHCCVTLADYKIPREIVAIDSIPKAATGKVLRKQLK